MKYNIRGDKLAVTKSIKDYIEEKLNRLNKYYENNEEIECKVIIRSKNNLQSIEVTIPTKKFILRAEVSMDDLYAAIDLVVDKLEGQIRKNKTRLNRNVKENIKEFNFDYVLEDDEEEAKEKIVRRKNIEMKPMDEEEAILEMELLGHSFFVYKDMDTNNTCVLYKRKDGDYGLIETK